MSVVRFDGVSKQFTLRHQRPRSFQDLFLNLFSAPRRARKEAYWVLKEMSFDVHPGEMLGIVGDNGVGKSTVLKLITRIIEPSSGKIDVNGRVSALLELGAGFHPELTGRENVYLNGSILGFSRAEMKRLFDDIVGFSEMEHFIDIPVKHYSLGMYMRLGFSIAVHVRPDILLVDEVLAVGDQAFQLRCLERINEVKQQGITIIFVTHDLETARAMCDRAIWLDDGRIRAEGDTDHVLDMYTSVLPSAQTPGPQNGGSDPGDAESESQEDPPWRWGSKEAEIIRVQLLDGRGRERRSFECGEPFTARLHFLAKTPVHTPMFGVALHDASGLHISGPNTVFSGFEIESIEGQGYIDFVVEHLPLLEGAYLLSASLYDHEGVHAYDHHHQAYTFRVNRSKTIRERYGSVLIRSDWRMGPVGGDTEP